MTTQEFKKKIYDTVEPLLDGQGQVGVKITEYDQSKLSLCWWDNRDDEIISGITLSELLENELFEYRCGILFYRNRADYKLDLIFADNATHVCELGCFFENWTGVEKVLQTFTKYLVKKFN